jgi:2-octaprenyl-6-methoxyphenol hydroxylase
MQVPCGNGSKQPLDVAVVGGGPTGLTAAIALAAAGVDTALVSRRGEHPDNRTTALMAGSVRTLETLDVWSSCLGHAAPLHAIRLVDDTGRLLRGPEILFDAAEIGLDAFGYNIENKHLVAALEARAGVLAHLARFDADAEAVEPGDTEVTVTLTDGRTLSARLVVAADGRRSRCRSAAGIASDARPYDQAALTVNMSHTEPHHGVSTEFHTDAGPFTVVPLPGMRSSLVWVTRPAIALHVSRREPGEIASMIERRSHGILGKVTLEGPCGVFRLTLERARRLADRRIALIGEAAHVIPPIGAQGLNLGLRDATAIAAIVAAARRDGADPGGPEVLARYHQARRADVVTRSIGVDLLNRSLLSTLFPVQVFRGLGLYLLEQIGPLRRAVMREGVLPVLSEPRLAAARPADMGNHEPGVAGT